MYVAAPTFFGWFYTSSFGCLWWVDCYSLLHSCDWIRWNADRGQSTESNHNFAFLNMSKRSESETLSKLPWIDILTIKRNHAKRQSSKYWSNQSISAEHDRNGQWPFGGSLWASLEEWWCHQTTIFPNMLISEASNDLINKIDTPFCELVKLYGN